SPIWNHYDKESSDKAKCKHCPASLCTKKGTTSNLWRHMETKHPEELATSKADFDLFCEKIVRLIAADNAAFRIVERQEFRDLFPPHTRMPTRYHLSKVIMPSMIETLRATISQRLTGKRVTLCVDQWTCKGGRFTLSCFTAHYINDKELALKSLPIPATSVSAERVFSAAGERLIGYHISYVTVMY
ncbi:hypothetical protein PMAYCL1PPCAC_19189, partial [Pristionchus mayeri]